MRIILVTGGVMSGIGKGITSSSIALLLKEAGAKVSMAKIDPYLNVDAGTMNPFEHGECFVLEDGMEADLDLGNYERFLEQPLTKEASITTGQIFLEVLTKERRGDFLGKTVQVVPDVTNAIIERVRSLAEGNDYFVIELGGTVGDIESSHFYMALRQMQLEWGRDAFTFVHVSCLLTDALKTKPTQHSVQELNRQGIFPDILCLRLPHNHTTIPDDVKAKLCLRCGVKTVIANPTCDSIYKVPHIFLEEGMLEALDTSLTRPLLETYQTQASLPFHPSKRIGVIGKYTNEEDAYLSVRRALEHAFGFHGCQVEVDWVDADIVVKNLDRFPWDGVIIPGGFGLRGAEAMLQVIEKCRVEKIPILGICLGFQLMVIDWARASDWPHATSEEFGGEPKDWVVRLHRDQEGVGDMGGTLRKGGYDVRIHTEDAISRHLLEESGESHIHQRFRYRHEVNPTWSRKDDRVVFTGWIDGLNDHVPNIFYRKSHPFFLGTQSHPEFTSNLSNPSPFFTLFVKNVLSSCG